VGARAAPTRARPGPSYLTLAYAWLVLTPLIRYVCVASVPLANGEAYYVSWARFPDWSYYDHPPLLAWTTWLATRVAPTLAMVRLGPVLFSALAALLIHRLALRLFSERAAFFAVVLHAALPVFLISSFVINPESALAPAWLGFLLVLERMRTRYERWLPLAAGLLVGVAFLAKYTAVLLVPSALLYLALSPVSRRWLRRPELWLGGLLALLVAAPVVLWNDARHWPSLQLHFVERAHLGAAVPGQNRFNEMVEPAAGATPSFGTTALHLAVGQLVSYSPLLSPLLVWGLVVAVRRARRDERFLFLSAMSVPVLAFLVVVMLRVSDAEQHWTSVGLLPAIVGAGVCLDEAWPAATATRWQRTLRAYVVLALVPSALAFLAVNVHLRTTAIVRAIPAAHYDPHADMANEMLGWGEVRDELREVAARTPGDVVLASVHYSLCGKLVFEMGDAPPVYCPTQRRSAFDDFQRRTPPDGATVLLLLTDVEHDVPRDLAERGTCTLARSVDQKRAGRDVAHYSIYSCPPAWSVARSSMPSPAL
jgi:4-amino-4-deoxy-L-arabinose transferase-like glycosyltransferase